MNMLTQEEIQALLVQKNTLETSVSALLTEIDVATLACTEANLTEAQQRQRDSVLTKLQTRYDNFIKSMKLIEARLNPAPSVATQEMQKYLDKIVQHATYYDRNMDGITFYSRFDELVN